LNLNSQIETHKIMKKIAIIGSGATAIYLLKHLMDNTDVLKNHIEEVAIFEKGDILGMGMPYNPHTTDLYNLSNIASEELPELIITFVDWLKMQDKKTLKKLGLANQEISKSEVYNRLTLGQYLQAQYRDIIQKLISDGIAVEEHPNSEVIDMEYVNKTQQVTIKIANGDTYTFDKVVVATGHIWTEKDNVETGYYASPWPIQKILPKEGKFHNFKIGTLGASLSAFDVASSLSRRHGEFKTDKTGKMTFHPFEGAENFSIALHSANGWLPNLQYEQEEPMREIYRHLTRDKIFKIIDSEGYLRIDTFFDEVCRPALTTAFKKDKMKNMVEKLNDDDYSMSDFINDMTIKHEYANAFEGMRFEMIEAKASVENNKPIHWKEVIDDLMYALNFHAELMPAEDHLYFQKQIMPFLMNVIAAMPLPSGNLLLALYDAKKLEIVTGYATVSEEHKKGLTTVNVKDGEALYPIDYKMFIQCGGQKPLNIDDYPFKSLVEKGIVRKARVKFSEESEAKNLLKTDKKELVLKKNSEYYFAAGGIDIDASYRVIGENDKPNNSIHDITFTHITGIRPYSYGLQACSATSHILVQAWVKSLEENVEIVGNIEEISELYEVIDEL
jgi:uncharacterized NAD(P)/FAD-binding protein YdhS